MNFNTILAITFLLIILVMIIKTMIKPIKTALKLCYSCILSGIGIFGVNILGSIIGMHIGLNAVNVIAIALLGLPGIALILFLQLLFKV